MPAPPETIDQAIAATREGLAAAGYTIAVGIEDQRVVFVVEAGPDACADCLVPKAIFATILGRELADAGLPDEFDLRYPPDYE